MSKRNELLEKAKVYTSKKEELDKDKPKEIVYVLINGKDHSSGAIAYDAFRDRLYIQRNNSNNEIDFQGESIDQLLVALKGLLE